MTNSESAPGADQQDGYVDDSSFASSTAEENGSSSKDPPATKVPASEVPASEVPASEVPASEVQLKRQVGLFSAIALIVGTMIGSGIFVSSSDLLARTQSPALCLLVWIACGAVSLCGSLSYAELGTMIPKSGGEYSYFLEAYGSTHGFWGPAMAFLFAWTTVLILKPTTVAAVCLGFANYLVLPLVSSLGICLDPDVQYALVRIVGILAIATMVFINCYSVTWATRVQIAFTAIKLSAIALMILIGLYQIFTGHVQYLNQGFAGSTTSLGKIATAFYSGLWAYDGWNNLNFITEELVDPHVNLPRAIMIGIPLTTVCYVLVNVAYLSVLSPAEMISAQAVAVSFAGRTLGVMAWLIPVAVCFSTFGSANGCLFGSGRLCYVASREGHLVDILSYVHIRRLTPSPAVLFISVIAVIMIIPGNLASLIDFFSFTAWIFYGTSMATVLFLRYTQPDLPRPYKVPIAIPIIVLCMSLYFVFAPIINNPQIEFLYAFLFILAGFIFYVPFVYHRRVMPGTGKISTFLQILLEVAPSRAVQD